MMWRSKQTVRVLAKGGILTPSFLLNILRIAQLSGNKHVSFGSRQDVLFNVSLTQMGVVEAAFNDSQIDYIIHRKKGQKFQNIVSSYVSSDLMPSVKWLSSGNYLQILDNFKYQPMLRVNIIDPVQSLVPYFFGHLNFIASSIQDYWYLYIRKDEQSMPVRWPLLILGNDIASVAQCIEQQWKLMNGGSVSEWFELVQGLCQYNGRRIEAELPLDFKYPFDYEGFNKMYNSQNYWAGFYWRNNSYDIAFLEEMCQLCFQTGISKICLTPWKSFVVKEVKEKDILQWNRLLGRYGITMRHSIFDLNWHLPLNDKHALRLKKNVVKWFDKSDVCVHGLTFGIKTKPEPDFYSIKIDYKPGVKFLGRFDIFESYTISYAKNFNPNLCEYIDYARQVPHHRVAGVLQAVSKKFFGQLSALPTAIIQIPKQEGNEAYIVHQCKHCLTVYDPTVGIPEQNIVSNTAFAELPGSFSCPLCEAPKSDFYSISIDKLIKQSIQ